MQYFNRKLYIYGNKFNLHSPLIYYDFDENNFFKILKSKQKINLTFSIGAVFSFGVFNILYHSSEAISSQLRIASFFSYGVIHMGIICLAIILILFMHIGSNKINVNAFEMIKIIEQKQFEQLREEVVKKEATMKSILMLLISVNVVLAFLGIGSKTLHLSWIYFIVCWITVLLLYSFSPFTYKKFLQEVTYEKIYHQFKGGEKKEVFNDEKYLWDNIAIIDEKINFKTYSTYTYVNQKEIRRLVKEFVETNNLKQQEEIRTALKLLEKKLESEEK